MIHLCDVKQEGGDAGLAARAEICFFFFNTFLLGERQREIERDPTVVHCYIFHVVMMAYHIHRVLRTGLVCSIQCVFTKRYNLCCINIKNPFTYSSSCQVTDLKKRKERKEP